MNAAAGNGLRLRLFGRFSLQRMTSAPDGNPPQELVFARRRAQALLAHLVLFPKQRSRARLAEIRKVVGEDELCAKPLLNRLSCVAAA